MIIASNTPLNEMSRVPSTLPVAYRIRYVVNASKPLQWFYPYSLSVQSRRLCRSCNRFCPNECFFVFWNLQLNKKNQASKSLGVRTNQQLKQKNLIAKTTKRNRYHKNCFLVLKTIQLSLSKLKPTKSDESLELEFERFRFPLSDSVWFKFRIESSTIKHGFERLETIEN